MPAATNIINGRHYVMTIEDGTTPTALSLVVPFQMGDWSGGPFRKVLRNVVAYENNGGHQSIAYGSRFYPEFSFTAQVAEHTNAAAAVLSDMVLFTTGSGFAAGESTLGDQTTNPEIVITHKFTLTAEGTDWGHDADSTTIFNDVLLTIDTIDAGGIDGPSTFAVSGIVYGTVTGALAMAE